MYLICIKKQKPGPLACALASNLDMSLFSLNNSVVSVYENFSGYRVFIDLRMKIFCLAYSLTTSNNEKVELKN